MNTTRIALFTTLLFGITLLLAGQTDESDPTVGSRIKYQEATFSFPTDGWKKSIEDESMLVFVKTMGAGKVCMFSFWPVNIFEAGRSWTKQRHIVEYLNYERRKNRPEDEQWSYATSGEREIAGNRYPVMPFRWKIEQSKRSRPLECEGEFILIFTEDVAERHRFYVVMTSTIHPPQKALDCRAELEAIIESITIGKYLQQEP